MKVAILVALARLKIVQCTTGVNGPLAVLRVEQVAKECAQGGKKSRNLVVENVRRLQPKNRLVLINVAVSIVSFLGKVGPLAQ